MIEKFNDWNELKKTLQTKEKKINIKERNIYYLSVGQNIGSETYGKGEIFLRPVIVLKKLGKNYFLGVPLTSQIKDGSYYFTFNRKNGKKNTAMLNQMKTFDTKRIVSYNGKVSNNVFKNLKNKIEEFLDITLTKSEGVPTRAKSEQSISDKNNFVNKDLKTILVTGCAGFIGSNFVPYFLDTHENINIINIDLLTYAGNLENLKEIENHPRYKFIKGDICNRELIEFIFEEYNITGVIHFAAESHVDNSIKNPGVFVQTNVNGTYTLVDVAKKYWMEKPFQYKEKYTSEPGSSSGQTSSRQKQEPETCSGLNLPRFHHISTDEVYGTLSDDPEDLFTETTPYAPNSPYSASKASSDMIIRSYVETFGMNCVITNCSNNYGPKQHNEKLIPTIIRNALKGNPIPIYGDGKNIRDWLYVLDHCKGIDLVYHKGLKGETYNIGGRNERTNLQIVNRICELLDEYVPLSPSSEPGSSSRQISSSHTSEPETCSGHTSEPGSSSAQSLEPETCSGLTSYKDLITFVEDRAGHDRRYAIDATKLENELGWKADENFDTGIVKTIEWYLNKYGVM